MGWSTSATAHSSEQAAGDKITLSATSNNLTYYAITTKKLTATFEKGIADSISSKSESCNVYNLEEGCQVTAPKIVGTTSKSNTVLAWSSSKKSYSPSNGKIILPPYDVGPYVPEIVYHHIFRKPAEIRNITNCSCPDANYSKLVFDQKDGVITNVACEKKTPAKYLYEVHCKNITDGQSTFDCDATNCVSSNYIDFSNSVGLEALRGCSSGYSCTIGIMKHYIDENNENIHLAQKSNNNGYCHIQTNETVSREKYDYKIPVGNCNEYEYYCEKGALGGNYCYVEVLSALESGGDAPQRYADWEDVTLIKYYTCTTKIATKTFAGYYCTKGMYNPMEKKCGLAPQKIYTCSDPSYRFISSMNMCVKTTVKKAVKSTYCKEGVRILSKCYTAGSGIRPGKVTLPTIKYSCPQGSLSGNMCTITNTMPYTLKYGCDAYGSDWQYWSDYCYSASAVKEDYIYKCPPGPFVGNPSIDPKKRVCSYVHQTSCPDGWIATPEKSE